MLTSHRSVSSHSRQVGVTVGRGEIDGIRGAVGNGKERTEGEAVGYSRGASVGIGGLEASF